MWEHMALAWHDEPELAVTIVQLTRDCRRGKGEKLVARHALLWLRRHKPRTYLANLLAFVQLGCFKDLLHLAVAARDLQLPLLGEHSSVPIELELLAEFLRHDRQALADFRSKQCAAAAQLEAAVTAGTSGAHVPAVEASAVEDSEQFELLVAPSAERTAGAFQARELASFEVVPRARLTIDLCFVIDCTGSMSSWIARVQRSVVQLARQIEAEGAASGVAEVRIRFACSAYRDYFDADRFQQHDFTADVAAFVAFVNGLSADGGADGPEDLVGGLDKALELSWDKQADARFLIVIADAPAHGKQFSSGDSEASLEYQSSHPEPALHQLVSESATVTSVYPLHASLPRPTSCWRLCRAGTMTDERATSSTCCSSASDSTSCCRSFSNSSPKPRSPQAAPRSGRRREAAAADSGRASC